MPGRSIRIGTFAGIPFGIHPLWLIIVGLLTWTLATGWYPAQTDAISTGAAWGLGLAGALLLFASIVAHEYGHAIVARRRGVEVEEIDLWLLGGVAKMRGAPRRPQDELAYAIAGPAVTLAIALVFGALTLITSAGTPLHALVAYQALVNVVLLAFNLIPAFPLDGGRVLRALLWRRSGDQVRATTTAAGLGRGFGFVLVGLGVLEALSGFVGGLWLALIGWFLVMASGAETLHAEVVEVFSGVHAGELMTAPAVCIPVTSTAAEAADRMLHEPHPAFPVVDGERVVGMISARAVEAVPPAQRSGVLVATLADQDPELLLRADADVAGLLDQPAFIRLQRAAVVDPEGHPVGVLSITDVRRAFDMRRRLAADGPGAGRPLARRS